MWIGLVARRPGERGDRGSAHSGSHRANTLEVARRGGCEARLDHVDAEALERQRDLDLLVRREGDTWGLLTVPECRVENRDPAALGHFSAPPGRVREGVPLVSFGRRVRLLGA
jgi:hypothetical protein